MAWQRWFHAAYRLQTANASTCVENPQDKVAAGKKLIDHQYLWGDEAHTKHIANPMTTHQRAQIPERIGDGP